MESADALRWKFLLKPYGLEAELLTEGHPDPLSLHERDLANQLEDIVLIDAFDCPAHCSSPCYMTSLSGIIIGFMYEKGNFPTLPQGFQKQDGW